MDDNYYLGLNNISELIRNWKNMFSFMLIYLPEYVESNTNEGEKHTSLRSSRNPNLLMPIEHRTMVVTVFLYKLEIPSDVITFDNGEKEIRYYDDNEGSTIIRYYSNGMIRYKISGCFNFSIDDIFDPENITQDMTNLMYIGYIEEEDFDIIEKYKPSVLIYYPSGVLKYKAYIKNRRYYSPSRNESAPLPARIWYNENSILIRLEYWKDGQYNEELTMQLSS